MRWEASLWLLATMDDLVLDEYCFNAAMSACEKSTRCWHAVACHGGCNLSKDKSLRSSYTTDELFDLNL